MRKFDKMQGNDEQEGRGNPSVDQLGLKLYLKGSLDRAFCLPCSSLFRLVAKSTDQGFSVLGYPMNKTLVPFGKYRGCVIDTLLDDHQYLIWYLDVPGIHAQFPEFHKEVLRRTAQFRTELEAERKEQHERYLQHQLDIKRREEAQARAEREGVEFALALEASVNTQVTLNNENYVMFRNLFPENRRGPVTQYFFNVAHKANAATWQQVIAGFYAQRYYDWHGNPDQETVAILRLMRQHPVAAKLFAEYALLRQQMTLQEREAMKARGGKPFALPSLEERPPSDKQIAFCRSLGYTGPILTAAQASLIISERKGAKNARG